MSDPAALRTVLELLRGDPDRLIEIALQQAAVIEELRARIAELEALVRDLSDRHQRLQQQVEQLQAAAKRPAAPFRIKDPKRCTQPRRPGRRAGHPGVARARPPVDEHIEVGLQGCPHCGGALEAVRAVDQLIEEIPPVRPHVVHLTTYRGHCPHCDCEVRSTHPLQVSTATGAAGVQLGPRALAMAAELNKHLGLTMRGTCRVLRTLFGLSLSPGGLAQALARVAQRLAPDYAQLQDAIRAGPLVHSDETSWWVGGPGYWLWVFTRPDLTLYRVADGRGRDVVLDTLGPTYPGYVISDCLAVYDGLSAPQQKCYAHHLKVIGDLLDQGPHAYAEHWRDLLLAAMRFKTAPAEERSATQRRALEVQADVLLEAPRRDPGEERLRRRLLKQRDHLFTFLEHPDVPATNNLAERQLRPAVIARKLSCGNKTPAGAHTWEVLASVSATCTQRGESFLDLVTRHVALAVG